MKRLESRTWFVLLTIVTLIPLHCYQIGDLQNLGEDSSFEESSSAADGDTDGDTDADSDSDSDADSDGEAPCVMNGGIWLVDRVEEYTDEEDGSTTIYLESGEQLRIRPGQRFREAWFIWIEGSLGRGEVASFFVDPAEDNTVLEVESTREYTVEWVENDPAEDHINIAFSISAAIHTLYRDHPCFDRFLTLLEEGLETADLLLVTEVSDAGIFDFWGIADIRRP